MTTSKFEFELPKDWRSISFDADNITIVIVDGDGDDIKDDLWNKNHKTIFQTMNLMSETSDDIIKIHHLMQNSCGDFDDSDMGTITFINLASSGINIKKYTGRYGSSVLLVDTGYGQYPITRDSINYNQVKHAMLKHSKIYLNNVDGCFQITEDKLPKATMSIELPYVACMDMIKAMNREPAGLWKIGSVIWKSIYLEIIWVDTTDETITKSFVIGGAL